jgi:hypothetical protein
LVYLLQGNFLGLAWGSSLKGIMRRIGRGCRWNVFYNIISSWPLGYDGRWYILCRRVNLFDYIGWLTNRCWSGCRGWCRFLSLLLSFGIG